MTRVHSARARVHRVRGGDERRGAVFAQVPITAVPPAGYRGRRSQKPRRATMLLPQATPALRIALPEPTAAERASLRDAQRRRAAQRSKATELKGPLARRISA